MQKLSKIILADWRKAKSGLLFFGDPMFWTPICISSGHSVTAPSWLQPGMGPAPYPRYGNQRYCEAETLHDYRTNSQRQEVLNRSFARDSWRSLCTGLCRSNSHYYVVSGKTVASISQALCQKLQYFVDISPVVSFWKLDIFVSIVRFFGHLKMTFGVIRWRRS